MQPFEAVAATWHHTGHKVAAHTPSSAWGVIVFIAIILIAYMSMGHHQD